MKSGEAVDDVEQLHLSMPKAEARITAFESSASRVCHIRGLRNTSIDSLARRG
jgi:hypothetical protein